MSGIASLRSGFGIGSKRKAKSKPKSRKKRAQPIEYQLVITATMCLVAFGAVMVFSASSDEVELALKTITAPNATRHIVAVITS